VSVLCVDALIKQMEIMSEASDDAESECGSPAMTLIFAMLNVRRTHALIATDGPRE
jgi:hypothetical protein